MEEVARFQIGEVSAQRQEDLQLLFLLAREGIVSYAINTFHQRSQLLNKFSVAQLLLSDNVLALIMLRGACRYGGWDGEAWNRSAERLPRHLARALLFCSLLLLPTLALPSKFRIGTGNARKPSSNFKLSRNTRLSP